MSSNTEKNGFDETVREFRRNLKSTKTFETTITSLRLRYRALKTPVVRDMKSNTRTLLL